MKAKQEITIRISPDIRQLNRHVCFAIGEETSQGQRWMGLLYGDESVGQWREVRRQIDADAYEYSRVQIIARETPVTGAVLLTLRESGEIAKEHAK